MIMDMLSVLSRYMAGEATPGEAEQLESWIAESADNRAVFEWQWKLMELTVSGARYQQPAIQNEWLTFQHNIRPLANTVQNQKATYEIVRKSFYKVFMYGIPGLVIIIAALLIFLQPNSPNSRIITRYSTGAVLPDTLSGGSVVFLDAHSSISYSAEEEKNNIITIRGGVYIEQRENQQKIIWKAGPFEIMLKQGNMFVAFDTVTQQLTVQVQKGNAVIKNADTSMVISAGKAMQGNAQTKEIRTAVPDVNLCSYATRIFDFNDLPLKDAAEYLEKAYDVSIKLQDQKMEHCRITTRFDNRTLREILDIMAFTLNIEYEYPPGSKSVLLSGKGCE